MSRPPWFFCLPSFGRRPFEYPLRPTFVPQSHLMTKTFQYGLLWSLHSHPSPTLLITHTSKWFNTKREFKKKNFCWSSATVENYRKPSLGAVSCTLTFFGSADPCTSAFSSMNNLKSMYWTLTYVYRRSSFWLCKTFRDNLLTKI